MSLSFCSFASGSSGNSYLVKSDTTSLIIDVGISGKKIFQGIESLGIEKGKIDGILITHEHIDHVRSLRIVAKKLDKAMVYSNIGTWRHVRELVEEPRQIVFETGKAFIIGDITVKPFLISHDATEPVGYSFLKGNKQVSILTDTGIITEDIFDEIKNADLLVIEANHDPEVLRFCSYPYNTKRRILGELGHLSNEAAGQCICRVVEEKPKKRRIFLSHLSKENNTPEIAKITIANTLETQGLSCKDLLKISVLHREGDSTLYEA